MENLNINLVLIFAIIIVLIIFVKVFFGIRQKSSSIIILDKIREINEYASHELNYFGNISYKEVLRILKFDIPFIKKGFAITILGKIKMGINMDSVKVSMFNHTLNITIPEIKILSHETKISEIGFQTKNPIFQNDFNDLNKKIEENKTIKENSILHDNELIKKVYDDLKMKITDLLLQNPNFSKKYKINYKIEMPTFLIEDTNSKNETEKISDYNS